MFVKWTDTEEVSVYSTIHAAYSGGDVSGDVSFVGRVVGIYRAHLARAEHVLFLSVFIALFHCIVLCKTSVEVENNVLALCLSVCIIGPCFVRSVLFCYLLQLCLMFSLVLFG